MQQPTIFVQQLLQRLILNRLATQHRPKKRIRFRWRYPWLTLVYFFVRHNYTFVTAWLFCFRTRRFRWNPKWFIFKRIQLFLSDLSTVCCYRRLRSGCLACDNIQWYRGTIHEINYFSWCIWVRWWYRRVSLLILSWWF